MSRHSRQTFNPSSHTDANSNSAATTSVGGGFVPVNTPASGLLSPPPFSLASSSFFGSRLPSPRQHPLKAGSPKETAYIAYVEKGILDLGRKFALREEVRGRGYHHTRLDTGAEDVEHVSDMSQTLPVQVRGLTTGDHVGYTSFKEAAKDLERLVDVVWVSGTPSLQIPHLLNLALLTVTYIPAFNSPSLRSMFSVLGKLDAAFASLLTGKDVHTGDILPGYDREVVNLAIAERRGGGVVSGTERVRIKSLVERTRIVVVEVISDAKAGINFETDWEARVIDGDVGYDRSASGAESTFESASIPRVRKNGMDVEMDDETETDTETEGDARTIASDEDMDQMHDYATWNMEMGTVYELTLNELGDSLGGPAIGIMTED